MKYPQRIGLAAILAVFAIQSIAQTVIYQSTNFPFRAIRNGTFSNRTVDGLNNPGNGSPLTWSFFDQTSWNSKFYNSDPTKPAYTEGHSTVYGSQDFDMNYRLLFPVGYSLPQNANYKYPLILFVHGAGERGNCWGSTCYYDVSTTSGAGTIIAGSNVLNRTSGSFNSSDLYKTIQIPLAGPGSSILSTYISAYNSSTQIVLGASASTTATLKPFTYGYGYGINGTSASGSMAINSNILTSTTGTIFTSNDVYKTIQVTGAGSAGGLLTSTITSFISSTQVTLASNALTAISNRNFSYGYGTNSSFRGNDLNLVHAGNEHLKAVYNANGKLAEDPTLPANGFPGFVVVPQTESGNFYNYDQFINIIDMLIATYNIDPDRIYIHGLSNGGKGAWEILRSRPDLFAAALPMSAVANAGDAIFNAEINKAVPIPSWIFQGGTDGNPTVNGTNQIVSKLRAAGASVRYTIYPTVGHGTWGFAYAEPDFFSWMLLRNKRDITVLYGDPTICPTNSNGVKLALSVGFLAYQWELDGAIISGATSSTYTATQPGTYRARFSRISATPSEAQWNLWSKPVVVQEAASITPTITAVGTSHLPDINGGLSVRINGPTTKDLVKLWSKNGVQSTTYPYAFPYTDTASYTVRTDAGRFSLKTFPPTGCQSLESNSIYVTTSTPITLVAPASPQAVVTGTGTIQLFWTDNTPNETGFEIFRATNGGQYDFFKLVSAGTTSYIDTGLAPNTDYDYQLRAVNNTEASDYTDPISVTTQADTQPPSAPQNVVVSGLKSLTQITLSWTASTDNTAIQRYEIYYGATTINTLSSATTYTVTGLTANSNYLFTVKAFDLAGNVSQPSNQLLATTTFTGLNYTYSAVNVTTLYQIENNWNTPEATGTCSDFDISLRKQDDFFNFRFDGYLNMPPGTYNFRSYSDDGSAIYLGASGATAFPFAVANPVTTNRIFNNDGLHGCDPGTGSTPNQTFTGTARPITVLMFEQQGGECLNIEYKSSSSGTWLPLPAIYLTSGSAPVLTPPAAPINFTATATGMSTINLAWTAAVGATSYEVYRSLDNATFTLIASANTNSFADSGLQSGTIYYYKLKSVSNTTGTSGFSLTANATTALDTLAPTIPSGVTILSSNYTNVGLSWIGSTDNVAVTGYKIYGNSILLGTSTTTTFYTNTLLPGTPYSITISAYDSGNPANESAQSAAANFTTNPAQTFYSKPSTDLSLTSSWGANTDGTGANPTSFAYDGQYFKIPSSQTQTLTNPLTIGGSVSRVFVDNGATLTVNQPLTGVLNVGNGSTVIFAVDYQPAFETISPSSTVTYTANSSIPLATYGNLTLSGTAGLKTFAAGTVNVLGNLTLANGVGLKGASDNLTTIKISGDLITATTVATAPADNRVALQFVGATAHNLTVSSDQFLYKLSAEANATVTFNNSGSPKSLNLGSPNGGGLDLANGSTLVLGSNHLTLINGAVVNPTNATGKIAIINSNISLSTTASSALPSNFYFDSSPNNRVQNFTLQATGGSVTSIRSGMEIYDGLKINSGTLSAGGYITLKSLLASSAAIQQIVSGSITGNVNVERYIAPKRVYRYMSSPVAGTKVADWQNYFPITGAFPESSPQSTNASMFYYDETTPADYIAFPVSSNQETLLRGRGYAAFIRENLNPFTMVSTGVPHQGTIPFGLTGVNVVNAPTGFNLVGNPYASDIVWNNTAWVSSNISNTISIRENNFDGLGNSRVLFWDRSLNSGAGGGTLPNGKIPAGQAFWVQATTASPSLSVTEAAKTTTPASGNFTFFRTETVASSSLFTLKLTNGTLEDYAFINLTDQGSDTYDKIRDGAKRPNSFFNLSTISEDGINLAINDVSNIFCEKTISVSLQPGENLATIGPGTYTLQFENLENFSLSTIQLVDSFLGTSTTISKSSPSYTIAVSGDAASYVNRLTIKLTRPSIITNNLLSATKDSYCRSEQNATLVISDSQIGVNYEAIGNDASSISEKVVGNGETIQLLVPIKNLTGQSTIRVRSYYLGCSSINLDNSKMISISELPIVSVPAEVAGCLGSKLTITADSNGSTFQWANLSQNISQSLSETSQSLEVYALNTTSFYSVKSISNKGCESEFKYIVVKADSLEIPKITLSTDGELLTDEAKNMQWLLDGNIISGANRNSYTPAQSGMYSVRASNTYCIKESPSIEYIVTGMEDNGKSSFSLAVFPNPSETGKITVTGNSSQTSQLQLQVTDLVGKELVNQWMSDEEFKKGFALETKWASGIYIVRVTQNGTNLHQKVIVR
jgi:chitodextrinase